MTMGMERSAHEDRISQLHDEIIHRILYQVDSPTEAAKTSTLSRRWLHLWRTYPVLEFRDSKFQNVHLGPTKFRSFAAASSRRLLAAQPSSLLALEVVRISLENYQLSRNWDESLEPYNLANLSPIEIDLRGFGWQKPEISLDFSRIRVINLSGFDLDALKSCSTNNVGRMERLEVLSLKFVTIRSEKALNIFTCLCNNAPNLTTLSLKSLYTHGLKTKLEIIVTSKKLKSLVIGQCPLNIHIISAPLLHTLKYDVPDPQFKLTVESSSSAPNLRVLQVMFDKYCRDFTQSHLDHLFLSFPSIRSLSLAICASDDDQLGMQRQSCWLRISSSNLRELRFIQFDNWWLGLHIDAPNLVTLLHYKLDAGLPVNNNAIRLSSVASSCQYEFVLSSIGMKLGSLSVGYRWFVELREFLAAVARSQPHLNLVLKLDKLHYLKQVTFDSGQATADYNGDLLLLVVQRLELGTKVMIAFDVEKGADALLDGIFSICHPNFLSVKNDYEYLFSYICGQLLKRDNVGNCCNNFKCWRHQLKSVKIKNGNDDHIIEISEDVVSSITKTREANFMLAWY